MLSVPLWKTAAITDRVSMTERFSLKTPKIKKEFKFDYNKGVVHDDGKITPIYA